MTSTWHEWQTVDFRPAAPGWRLAYLLAPEDELSVDDLPGWLIQEEVRLTTDRGEGDVKKPYRDNEGGVVANDRRVVPSMIVDGALEHPHDDHTAYVVLGPNATELTESEVDGMREDLRRRQELAARLREQRRRPAGD